MRFWVDRWCVKYGSVAVRQCWHKRRGVSNEKARCGTNRGFGFARNGGTHYGITRLGMTVDAECGGNVCTNSKNTAVHTLGVILRSRRGGSRYNDLYSLREDSQEYAARRDSSFRMYPQREGSLGHDAVAAERFVVKRSVSSMRRLAEIRGETRRLVYMDISATRRLVGIRGGARSLAIKRVISAVRRLAVIYRRDEKARLSISNSKRLSLSSCTNEPYMDGNSPVYTILWPDMGAISCCCATLRIELCGSSTKDNKTFNFSSEFVAVVSIPCLPRYSSIPVSSKRFTVRITVDLYMPLPPFLEV